MQRNTLGSHYRQAELLNVLKQSGLEQFVPALTASGVEDLAGLGAIGAPELTQIGMGVVEQRALAAGLAGTRMPIRHMQAPVSARNPLKQAIDDAIHPYITNQDGVHSRKAHEWSRAPLESNKPLIVPRHSTLTLLEDMVVSGDDRQAFMRSHAAGVQSRMQMSHDRPALEFDTKFRRARGTPVPVNELWNEPRSFSFDFVERGEGTPGTVKE